MQTFLPFPDFEKSAELLDKKRCWKQVVEAHQILKILRNGGLVVHHLSLPPSTPVYNIGGRWKNHPVMHMWAGYEDALIKYYSVFHVHSVRVHNIKPRILKMAMYYKTNPQMPPWLGNIAFHQSHINNLARKALEGKAKGREELYNNMAKAGLQPEDQHIQGKYIWP